MTARLGSLALVLHSHMPYVEGYGTYPFGEEWLFDAVIRSYAPVTAAADRVTFTVTPALADQLEADGVSERLLEFLRRFRIESCEADERDVEPPYRAACRAEAGAGRGRHRHRAARGGRGRPVGRHARIGLQQAVGNDEGDVPDGIGQ